MPMKQLDYLFDFIEFQSIQHDMEAKEERVTDKFERQRRRGDCPGELKLWGLPSAETPSSSPDRRLFVSVNWPEETI